jgi:hypothetical protein
MRDRERFDSARDVSTKYKITFLSMNRVESSAMKHTHAREPIKVCHLTNKDWRFLPDCLARK